MVRIQLSIACGLLTTGSECCTLLLSECGVLHANRGNGLTGRDLKLHSVRVIVEWAVTEWIGNDGFCPEFSVSGNKQPAFACDCQTIK
jgi:hypothetical protein